MLPQDPSWEDTPPPLPPPSPAKKHNTPKNQNTHPSGSVASLLAQFQQSRSQDASPKNMPSKNTPVKDTPKKGEQMPSKKLLMLDKSAEPPIKKQWTGSPSSEWESKTDHDKAEKSKKKKKEPKSKPTVATDSEAEETEERQEKCQQVRKWKQELKQLQEYRESCNIFLHMVPEWSGGSHTGYLESHILDAGSGYFFIKSFKEWRIQL